MRKEDVKFTYNDKSRDGLILVQKCTERTAVACVVLTRIRKEKRTISSGEC
jgi:hypothetical protein